MCKTNNMSIGAMRNIFKQMVNRYKRKVPPSILVFEMHKSLIHTVVDDAILWTMIYLQSYLTYKQMYSWVFKSQSP